MRKSYLTEDRNAAAYAASPMAMFSVVTPITVVSTVGTVSVYGPPILNPDGTVATAPTAADALRGGHRVAIYRVTGGVGAGGTYTAGIFTFISTRDTATPYIIARASNIVDMSTVGGWSLHSAALITPFAPTGFPLAIAEPGYGIKMSVAAAGSDGTILCEMLIGLIPTSVAGPA